MPTLHKIYTLDITPEKFIDNCSEVELRKIILLANAKLSLLGCEVPPAPSIRKRETLPVPSLKPLPASKPSSRKRQNWTPAEDAMLRDLWQSIPGKEIATKLNRDYKVVMAHAAKLGLRKNKPKSQQLPPAPEELAPQLKSKKQPPERKTDCITSEISRKSIYY
jgi:hypothetical protein